MNSFYNYIIEFGQNNLILSEKKYKKLLLSFTLFQKGVS